MNTNTQKLYKDYFANEAIKMMIRGLTKQQNELSHVVKPIITIKVAPGMDLVLEY